MPEEIAFATKGEIAWAQIEAALDAGIARGTALFFRDRQRCFFSCSQRRLASLPPFLYILLFACAVHLLVFAQGSPHLASVHAGVSSTQGMPGTIEPCVSGELSAQTDGWKAPKSGWLFVLDYSHDYDLATDGGGEVLVVKPDEAKIVGTINVGSAPVMLLSPNGARLYVASIRDTGDVLEVVDTDSGIIVQRVLLSARAHYTVRPAGSKMAISYDGRWLYMLKLRMVKDAAAQTRSRPLRDVYTVAVFDTQKGVFLSDEAPVSDCVGAVLLPFRRHEGVEVFCTGSNQVHSLAVTAKGLAVQHGRTLRSGSGDWWRSSVATGGLTGTDNIIAVMMDGRLFEIDSAAVAPPRRASVTAADSLTWIPVSRAPQSRDGRMMYIPVAQVAGRHTGLASEIRVLDWERNQIVGSIRTSQPFLSVVLSGDGHFLYAACPETQSILVIDPTTYNEIRTISGIGRSPVMVEVAP